MTLIWGAYPFRVQIGVHICSFVEQQLTSLSVSLVGCMHQSRHAILEVGEWVISAFSQSLAGHAPLAERGEECDLQTSADPPHLLRRLSVAEL